MAGTGYLCDRFVRRNTPQESEQEKRRPIREVTRAEDSAAGAADGDAAVTGPRL